MHRGSTAKALFPTAASVAVAGIMRCDLIAFICASWSVTAYTQAADYYWTSVLITGVSSSKFQLRNAETYSAIVIHSSGDF